MLDLSLQIDHQAWAILHCLNKFEWPSHYISTAAWYNGREEGISLSTYSKSSSYGRLLVTFGEARNSDSIFVDAWKVDYSDINPPTVKDFNEEAYKNRAYFGYDETYKAALHIHKVIENYYNS
jgi:hypothetical protein